MRAAWRGADVELLVEPTASVKAENASRALPLLLEREIRRAVVVCAPLHLYRRASSSRGSTAPTASRQSSVSRLRPRSVRALLWKLGPRRRAGASFGPPGGARPDGALVSGVACDAPASSPVTGTPRTATHPVGRGASERPLRRAVERVLGRPLRRRDERALRHEREGAHPPGRLLARRLARHASTSAELYGSSLPASAVPRLPAPSLSPASGAAQESNHPALGLPASPAACSA